MTLSQHKRWFDDMVLELRLRDIDGAAIGDAVAAARAHCEDSGETPTQAFGDPREYARSLPFGEGRQVDTPAGEWARVLAPVAAGLIGFSLMTGAVPAVVQGRDVDVVWGGLASAAVLIGATLLAMRHLRALLEKPVRGLLLVGGLFVVLVLLPVLWSTPALAMSPLAAAITGAVALGLSVVLGRRARDLADPVVDPVTGADRYPSRFGFLARAFTGEWMFVTLTVLIGALLWGLAVLVP
ncbi:hypothetical protein [Mobilicoccus sp.]|uniref:hypothetical protein n=1 Tax=Mobilicoccus sp. TaxID=2034349 RepID=UPI0028A856EE|nr:hypothetical protein [Mobilicoccus sp.]